MALVNSGGLLVIILVPVVVVLIMFLHLYSKYRINKEAQARELQRVQVLQRRRERQAQLGLTNSDADDAANQGHHQYDEVALLKFFTYDTVGKETISKKPKMQFFRSKPKVVAIQEGGVTSDEEDWCCICLEGYKGGEVTCTPKTGECNHVFHKKCLFGWVKKNHSECPICRCVFIT